ncbi:hypothetical protein UNSWDHB_1838 [Dehalobacter sp. UNSWDHB]|uniref:hypothetical protein n=1 Tax=Dehalobacter sp. UNSWDHB TaxID=1339256 RepID=UPI00038D8023|nr:hypothetical protein [Dehalobacter sp. UNSWDHB]EQB20765.1 hypothetical protein UNSWDHB_1838 [Dehalobacter sp. UNSWDHB]
MKNRWSKPLLTDLTMKRTEYDYGAPGADDAWESINLNGCPIPDGVIGVGSCVNGCPNT